jgi:hypothetical protein
MPLYPPLCLEVVFTTVADYAPNQWQCTLAVTPQGYGTGLYTGLDISAGQFTSNASYGFVYRIVSFS